MLPEIAPSYKSGLALPFDSLKSIRGIISATKGWLVGPTLKSHLEKSIPPHLPNGISYSFMISDEGEYCHWFCHKKSGKYLRLS